MKNAPKDSFKLIWSIVMSLVYLGIAYLVVFTPVLIPYSLRGHNTSANDENFFIRIFLGVILLIYGIYRGYRVIKLKK